jgi:signal transduction histidine kinase
MKEVLDALLRDYTNIGVAVVNPETRVLFANRKMQIQYRTAVGEPFPNTRLGQVIKLALTQNREVVGIPLQEIIEGKPHHLLLYVYPQRENDEIRSLVVFVCDANALNAAFESRIHEMKQHIINEMAAGMANIVLNPLAVLKGLLQLIEKSIRNDPFFFDWNLHTMRDKLDQYFHLAYKHVDQIDGILRRFLLLDKPDETKWGPVSVIDFMQRLIPEIQREAINRKIKFVCEYPNAPAQILAHELYLKEVFDALIRNAFEATCEYGLVTIKTVVTDQSVEFIIADEGGGIDEQLISRVKEPFFTTKEDALGFGLTFCDSVLRKMGGTLEIANTGKGTEVRVALPKIR